MRIAARLMAALALVASAAVVSIGTASASTSFLIGIGGSFTTASGASGPVGGQFSIASFADQDGQLVAVGTVSYSFCMPGVDPKNCLVTLTQPLSLPVSTIASSCGELELGLSSSDVVSPYLPSGFTIHFDAASLSVSTETAPAARVLCALGHELDAGATPKSLAPLLTQLIRFSDGPRAG
jgi:hypothetical protein